MSAGEGKSFKIYFSRARTRYGSFNHAAHLHVTWAMLRDYPALEALARFRTGLKALASELGLSGKYHETLTVAWFFLVLERMDRTEDWETFVTRNPDLFHTDSVREFYPPGVLGTDEAREHFVLPEKTGSSG